MRNLRPILPIVLVTLAGCAGGTTVAPTPQPAPTPTFPVDLVLFYDEDANGTLDVTENVRVPGVTVRLGEASGRSERRTGAVHLGGVTQGAHEPEILAGPPFFQAGALPYVAVPAPTPVALPLTLDIGANRRNVYMAFGDSITVGLGSTSGTGYRELLAVRLRSYFGAAKIVDEGLSGTRTARARERLGACLDDALPAYTLVLYGSNDWNDAACKHDDGCPTVENLQVIIRQIRAADSLPIVGTLPPANPDQNPASRNEWVARTNEALRPMIVAEGAVVADIHRAFLAEPSLPPLFDDHVHPNDQGYALIAREFFRAVAGDPTAELGALDPVLPAGPRPRAEDARIEDPRPESLGPPADDEIE